MSDLISRQAVLIRVKEYYENPSYLYPMLISELENLPSAEPEERTAKVERKGYVVAQQVTATTSHIPTQAVTWDECGSCHIKLGARWQYCPSCGARLEWE